MKKRLGAIGVFFLLIFFFAILAVPAESEKKIAKKAGKLMVKALEAINMQTAMLQRTPKGAEYPPKERI